MKESSKFLIIGIVIAIFTIAIMTGAGLLIGSMFQGMAPGNPDGPMKNETFDNVTISVPETSNFTNESGAYVDNMNGIVIQFNKGGIDKARLSEFSTAFAKDKNLTETSLTGLNDSMLSFTNPENQTLVLVFGEDKIIMIVSANEELGIKIANSVKFN